MHDTEEFEQLPFGVVNDYTNSFHLNEKDVALRTLLMRAKKEHVSVVTPNVAQLLEMLVTIHQPGCILELGTAYGVSAYHMLKGLKSQASFTTIDLVCERQAVAKQFLHDQGMDYHDIHFVCDDFRSEGFFENLAQKSGPFDFVFIDAAKGQYSSLLETLLPYIQEGGLIVFDNIFLNGWIVRNKYPNHRQKTAFLRMKQFLEAIKNDERFVHTLLPLDDGVLILAKRGVEE